MADVENIDPADVSVPSDEDDLTGVPVVDPDADAQADEDADGDSVGDLADDDPNKSW